MDGLLKAFFSYCRTDRPIVEILVTFLSVANVRVLWDGAIKPGQLWEEVILDWLDEADLAYAFWSRSAADSEWVELELDLLASEAKNLVPVMLDDTPLPDALSVRQGIEFSGLLKKWTRVGAIGAAPINASSAEIGMALRQLFLDETPGHVLNKLDAHVLSRSLSEAGDDHSRDTVRSVIRRFSRGQ